MTINGFATRIYIKPLKKRKKKVRDNICSVLLKSLGQQKTLKENFGSVQVCKLEETEPQSFKCQQTIIFFDEKKCDQ